MELFKYRTLFERRRLPLDPKSWLRTIRLILQSPHSRNMTGASPDGQFGSGLHTFFDLSPPARLGLVQSVGERIIKTVGANFQSIYRIDVTKRGRIAGSILDTGAKRSERGSHGAVLVSRPSKGASGF